MNINVICIHMYIYMFISALFMYTHTHIYVVLNDPCSIYWAPSPHLSCSGWKRQKRPGLCASPSRAWSALRSCRRHWPPIVRQWQTCTVICISLHHRKSMTCRSIRSFLIRQPITKVGSKPGRRWLTPWKRQPLRQPDPISNPNYFTWHLVE